MMENQSKQSFDSNFLINKDVSIFLFDLSFLTFLILMFREIDKIINWILISLLLISKISTKMFEDILRYEEHFNYVDSS